MSTEDAALPPGPAREASSPPKAADVKRRFPKAFYNTTTLIGAALAALMLCVILMLTVIEMLSGQQHPYMGLVTFILLPIFLNFGLVMAVVGYVRAARRIRDHGEEPALPRLDLNVSSHRRTATVVLMGLFMFAGLSAFGSYKAYEYTDSVEFCGQTCHTVMKPEYVAYQGSPHARVSCSECHIGAGATWFVRSKLSGSYQVYSTIFHKYHHPIETPVANLRPARETCEQCHWPRQFYSAKMQGKTYYQSDDKNTRSDLNMLVKIGGGDPRHGATEGIHYHMYIANQISYVTPDKTHETIPYVERRGPDGKLTIYRSTENPLTDAQVSKEKKLLVDCTECHNRPTHIFHHPAQSVDQDLTLGRIPADLPEVKRLAVETLEKPYKTEREALEGIRTEIGAFYAKSYPQVAAARKSDVERAITQTQQIYSHNYFPEMKVSWKAHPDHIGHMYSAGCFRCHDGKHVSSDGQVITNNCNACHTILSQNAGGKLTVSLDGQEFRHPVEIGDAWKTMSCSSCHNPGP